MISYVITAKDSNDPKLADLIESIHWQVGVHKEIIVVTEGTSESAKAIGIERSHGDIVCILASDNEFVSPDTSFVASRILNENPSLTGCYPAYYFYSPLDPALNRYFSLIGANDPLAYCLGKCDRDPISEYREGAQNKTRVFRDQIPTLGDNGFFVRRELITQSDLSHYYHIDVCEDLRRLGHYTYAQLNDSIWHKTGDGTILNFFRRRARFGAQHAFNTDRRWHLVSLKDSLRLLWFAVSAATLVHPTIVALNGYRKLRDIAWMLHPLMCLGTLLTYAFLVLCLIPKYLTRLLSAPMGGQKA